MANWPDIEPAEFPMEEKILYEQVRTQFDAGYVQSRKKFTKPKRQFTQTWGVADARKTLLEAEYQLLDAFFLTNQGGGFNWTHPFTGVSYVCRFSGDELKGSVVAPGLRKVECPIEEV